MNKIIIHYGANIEPTLAISLVEKIIAKGRVSEAAGRKHYCWVTVFRTEDNTGEITVYVDRKTRDNSPDTFKVMRTK